MTTRVASKRVVVEASGSPLAFDTSECEVNPAGMRYLTIGGERAFEMGNFCGTCAFLFDRLRSAPLDGARDQLDELLRGGINGLDPWSLELASLLMPNGDYDVSLHEVTPRLVNPGSSEDYFTHEQAALWGVSGFDHWTGLPHYPHTAYYRAGDVSLDGGRMLFEFIVPLVPQLPWLNPRTLDAYNEALESGKRPTALALSVLDVKQPAVWKGDPKITEHWCLVHYLLDGHPKMRAASTLGRQISLLSFLARGEGASSQEQVEAALDAFGRPTHQGEP